jgi:hypothetical protein
MPLYELVMHVYETQSCVLVPSGLVLHLIEGSANIVLCVNHGC